MKTTLDIPDADLKTLLKNTGATTKREAILTAVRKFNRMVELRAINSQLKGQMKDFMSVEELMEMRKASMSRIK
jgi:hypothetical protein